DAIGDRRSAEIFTRTDRLSRDAFANDGGREIDRTDGFLVLFERASDAIRCALSIHAGLAALANELGVPLAARASVHVGELGLRENARGEVGKGARPMGVGGLAKPFAARILGATRERQTLVSRTAADLAQRSATDGTLPSGTRFVAHGSWSMKGIAEPVEL